MTYCIHKKLGTIQKIPDEAAGYMNQTEWDCYDRFPTEEQYFESINREVYVPTMDSPYCSCLFPYPAQTTEKLICAHCSKPMLGLIVTSEGWKDEKQ